MAIGEPPPMPQACTGKPSASSGRQAFFLISEKFVLDLFSRLCLGRRHPGSPRAYSGETRGGAGSGRCDRAIVVMVEVVAVAVERREGARAYVTGARGHPRKVFRRVPSRLANGRGTNTPRVRRSAPAPSRRSAPSGHPEGLILRCSSA